MIRPQPGPQERFLSTSADIAIYGGAAGGGKSFALMLEGLRNIGNPKFRAVFFRREYRQIFEQGGLWDEANALYRQVGGDPRSGQNARFCFPSGAEIGFAHLNAESDVYAWQGAQVPLFLFDELTHFSSMQFRYMLSRNRSTSGVRPYIRASCNPEMDSWVEKLLEWYIDQDSKSETYGLAIPERSGVVRWMIADPDSDSWIWGDSKDELIERTGCDEMQPLSFTFVSAKLQDNKILMDADPGYKARLQALTRVERARLLDGNWKVAPVSGSFFRREEFRMVEAAEAGTIWGRGWDFAATEMKPGKDPDWSATMAVGYQPICRRYVIGDARRWRERSAKIQGYAMTISDQEPDAIIAIPEDPGAGGKFVVDDYVRKLAGRVVRPIPIRTSKVAMAEPFAIQVQRGNFDMVIGEWNNMVFTEFEAFPTPGVHDDLVDAGSLGFKMVATGEDPWLASVAPPTPEEIQAQATEEARPRDILPPRESVIPSAKEDDMPDWM